MNNYIIYFDFAAIAVNILVLTVIIIRKIYRGKVGFLLFWFNVISLLCTIFDLIGCISSSGVVTLYITNTFYFLLRSMTGFMCGLFMIVMTENEQQIKNSKIYKVLFITPIVVALGFILTNPLTHLIFRIDETNTYYRGPLICILFFVGWGYLFFSLAYVIKYRKIFSKNYQIGLYIIPFVVVIPSLIQMLVNANLLIEMFSTSIALLICMLLCFNRNGLHTDAGQNNFQSFESSLKISFFSKEKRTHVLLKIDGYEGLKSIINFKEMYSICNIIMKEVSSISSKVLYFATPYYLGKGLYVVSFSQNNKNDVDNFINIIDNRISSLKFSGLESDIKFKNIKVRTPDDVDSTEGFINLIEFVNNNEDRLNSTGEYKNIFTDKDFIIESDIHGIIDDALKNNKFEVFYQPIYSIKDDVIKSVEALLRLNNEKYGYINPTLVVSAAEKNGTINEIGLIVLEKACEFMSSDSFTKAGLQYMEINLSFNQLLNPLLPKSIIEITTKYNVSPKNIVFEITESRTAFNLSIITENINELVNMGFALSLDDYGTGYSNIKRMMSIPFSIIKIDKSFVDSIDDEKMGMIVVDTIKLFRSVNYEIVVEGVETQKEYDFFKDLGCEYIQGYYFSQPLNHEDLINYINERKK